MFLVVDPSCYEDVKYDANAPNIIEWRYFILLIKLGSEKQSIDTRHLELIFGVFLVYQKHHSYIGDLQLDFGVRFEAFIHNYILRL